MERPRPPPPLPTARRSSPILASPPRFQDKGISAAARETSARQRDRQSKRLSERQVGNSGNLNPPCQNERQQTSLADVILQTLYYLFLPKSLKRQQASWPALGDPTQSTRRLLWPKLHGKANVPEGLNIKRKHLGNEGTGFEPYVLLGFNPDCPMGEFWP